MVGASVHRSTRITLRGMNEPRFSFAGGICETKPVTIRAGIRKPGCLDDAPRPRPSPCTALWGVVVDHAAATTPICIHTLAAVPLAGPVMVHRGWSSKPPSDNGDGPSEKSPTRSFQSMLQEEPVADVADDAVPSFQSILGNNAAAGPSGRGGPDAVSPPPEVMRANEPNKKKKNRLIEPLTGQHSQPAHAVCVTPPPPTHRPLLQPL